MSIISIITSNNLDNTTLTLVNGKLAANDPTKVANSVLAQPNGVATLGGDGKIPTSQLPASIFGGLSYVGSWDASTNTPALVTGTGVKGNYYQVSVSGSTTLDGNSLWKAGDLVAFSGSAWQQIEGGNVTVRTVAGRSGDVVLTTADLSDFSTATNSLATAAITPVANSLANVVTTQNTISSSLSSAVTTQNTISSSLSSLVVTDAAVSSSVSSLASTLAIAPTLTYVVDTATGTVSFYMTVLNSVASTYLQGSTLTDASGTVLGIVLTDGTDIR